MAMTRLEKRFVNRKRKAERNIDKVRQRLEELEVQNIHDVLELGCGIGAVSAFLAETYRMNVYGIDFDPEQVEVARTMYPEGDRLRYKIEDASNLSYENGSFDLVLSQNVFHHIPAWDTAVREVARVLRPRGYFIWLDLGFSRLIKRILQPFVREYGLYTIDEIQLQFTECGFKQKFYERHVHGPFIYQHLVLQKNNLP